MRALAAKAEVSAGFLSQLERGLTSARVETLRRLAGGLGVPLARLFSDADLSGSSNGPEPTAGPALTRVVRRAGRKKLIAHDGRLFELLTPDLRGAIEFLWIEVPPGTARTEPMAHQRHGEECALVITGTMDLTIGNERHVLEAGDSVRFDPGIPHSLANLGDDVLIHVTAITPPSF